MKIIDIKEESIKLNLSLSNSMFSFKEMTTSIVKVDIDDGKSIQTGFAFNSTGRYACGAQMRNRFIPRLLSASESDLVDDAGDIDTKKALDVMLVGEKPGGDMERSVPIGTIETALWDAISKSKKLPLYKYLSQKFPEYNSTNRMFCYVGGGYYDVGKTINDLKDEIKKNFENGYRLMKIKIGGAPIKEDIRRVEAAIEAAGSADNIALDANGGLKKDNILTYAKELKDFGLSWFEEPTHPSNFSSYKEFISNYEGSVAGGENLYSTQDYLNLIKYGGFRENKDLLQIDIPQSYGISYFNEALIELKKNNWNVNKIMPHGGNQMSLHVACGFGLSMCEAYPNVFGVFSGYDDEYQLDDGYIDLSDRPGIGFEGQNELYRLFKDIK
ncbi:MAG: enolase C-terminal domain-like protein [Hyphomicrobiales bacterium]|jgi:D(-)-tartrate dehydratase|nr:enolase C-terminal domain-like protein [Hyphomicrobiales bacterium]|tara:strand:+ start:99 stop:1253 length:1155 start_codon:yes stop_codon:yes gene_type:complete